MAENKISYLNRNYNEYRESIREIARTYYPDVFANLSDASIGQFLIDVISDVGDNLNYHIDRTVQETSLDSARMLSSVMDMARTNGLHIPYKKAALVEIELSCDLPLTEGGNMLADENYAPYVKLGTQFSNGTTTFELQNDVDFKQGFDENGYPNRQIVPNRDTNGNIISYTYKKLAVATASQIRIMKQVITQNEIRPFFEILIPDSDVIGVESVIVKEGTNINSDPQFSEFYVDEENYFDKRGLPVQRFFEVDNLLDQYRFGYVVDEAEDGKPIGEQKDSNKVTHENYYNPVWEISEKIDIIDDDDNETSEPLRIVAKGKWKRLKNKFITEYTDDWHLKLIFGAGIENKYGKIPNDSKKFTQYQMSRMIANDYMGVLPRSGCTLYILYRIGGGDISNIATNTLTNIIGLNIEIDCSECDSANPDVYNNSQLKIRDVRRSMRVTNTTPSYGGKDAPTAEEIRYLIKYNAGSQNRCVTLKDYYSRIGQMPAKYGCPFRYNVIEENNKVVVYTLGLDYLGHLTNFLAEAVAENMKEYLSQYRMINDFIEIKSGKIINLRFRATVYVDKSYDKSEVTKRIIDLIYDYMDIRRHFMGEDIFIGDLQKEISKMDGVLNLVKLRIFNMVSEAETDDSYSKDAITQPLVDTTTCNYDDYDEYETDLNEDMEIDLLKSDYMLFSEANSMFEIKNKMTDIKVIVKTRN